MSGSLERGWSRDQEVLPHVVRNTDGSITLQNIRDLQYRNESDFKIRFQERTIHPDTVSNIELVVAPFWGLDIAHTFLIFHFTEGESLALSIEARRRKDQRFSLKALLPRQFRLMYVWGTERDIVRLRKHIWRIPIERLRLSLTEAQTRSIFLAALKRTEEIEEHDEWYHLITNNCTNNITSIFRGAGVRVPWFHWRYLLSSSIGEVFRSRQLLETPSSRREKKHSILATMPLVSPEETQPTPAPASKFSIQNPTIRKIIGAILILIGLLALVTPLTPGAWLGLIGLEMLGIRLVFMKPFKVWLQKKGWWR